MLATRFVAALACLAASHLAFAQSLPPTPAVQVAVNPVTNKVYAVDTGANAVTVLDASTGTSKSIAVGSGPQFVAVDPTRNQVYVNNSRDASLSVIDGSTDTVVATHAIGSMGPIAIDADPANLQNVVYVVRMTTAASDEVTYFYPPTPTWYTIATDSFQPNALAVNPATHTIYVTHYATGDVRIVDGTFNGNDFPHPPSLGMWSHPFAVAANPATGKAYVITEDSRGPIGVVNSATDAVFPAVASGHAVGPRAILVNSVTNKVYAAFQNEVIVIDGATNALTYIPISGAGSGGIALGINHATNRIYAATELGTLNVIDGNSNTVESTSTIPAGTSSIGVNPVTNTLYLYANGLTALAGAAGTPTSVPITTSIAPLAGNSSGPSGSIALSASTTFAGLPVRKVYYRLDSTSGAWTEAANSGGGFTASFSSLAPGSHTLYAFAVDDQVAPLNTSPGSNPLVGAIASYTFTVSGATVTPSVSLASSANPSNPGQSVTFTASVSGSAGTATGTATFLDGTATLCNAVALASGAASCATSTLSAGSHTVTARYSGDASYASATSGAVTQTVKGTATLALASSANPSNAGQSVTFTATASGSLGTPSGSVAFLDGATTICASAMLSSGSASCVTSSLAAGSHSITVRYAGDATYAGSTSSVLTQSVQAIPTVSVSSSPNPSTEGQAVSFSLSVSGSSGTANGTVDVLDGGVTLAGCASLTLSAGAASCSSSALAAGSHSITARYSGDAVYASAASTPLSQSVAGAKIAATVALSSSKNPSNEGDAIGFTATIGGSGATPTGTVSFLDGGNAIAGCISLALSGGTATCAAGALASGTHPITAQYSGDGAYNAGNSSVLNQVVNAVTQGSADLSVALRAGSQDGTAGKDVVVTLDLGNAGPDDATSVTLTAPLPANAAFVWAPPACSFDGASVTCAAGTLTSGAATSFIVVFRPIAAGSMTANASIASAQGDPASGNNTASLSFTIVAPPVAKAVPRYRLYNPISLEHLFTTDLNEYNVLGAGGVWVQEGQSGSVLDNPGSFNGVAATPYYRLYNTASLWHHWTTDPNEYYTLVVFAGWNGEGVDGYLLPQATAGATQLYRLVYPNGTGLHHWTIDRNEYDTLIATYGWVGEGGSGFVLD